MSTRAGARALAALAAACLAPGCASVTGTPTETVAVQAQDAAGSDVKGATCELTNSRGKWMLIAPGSTTVARSNDNLVITCRKAGYDDGVVAVASATRGEMFGNVILGGVVGAVIDHNSGAAYAYPQQVTVRMGATQVFN